MLRPETLKEANDRVSNAIAELPIFRQGRAPDAGFLPELNLFAPTWAQGDDNSNSQFAMLALWAARRHDVPVEHALLLAEQRYRTSQHKESMAQVIASPVPQLSHQPGKCLATR